MLEGEVQLLVAFLEAELPFGEVSEVGSGGGEVRHPREDGMVGHIGGSHLTAGLHSTQQQDRDTRGVCEGRRQEEMDCENGREEGMKGCVRY